MTSKLTRAQAEDAIEGLEGLINRGVQSVYLDMAITGIRQLLATIDSEPVAWKWRLVDLATGDPGKWRVTLSPSFPGKGMGYRTEAIPLYRHAQQVGDVVVTRNERGDIVAVTRQDVEGRVIDIIAEAEKPAPASEPITVTDDMAYAFHHALTDSMIGADDVEEIKTGLRAVFANLTAPVVSAKYPDRLPCSVLLEPGMRFGKGIKTSTMLAALARRSVYESDMAALSPEERAEFQARIDDFKALIAQPTPVVPEEKPMPNPLSMYDADAVAGIADVKVWNTWNACRAARKEVK